MTMTQDTEEKIIHAALALSAQNGWRNFSMRDLEQELSSLPLPLRYTIKSKNEILSLMNRRIDQFVEDNIARDDSTDLKDVLFDFFMLRLEWLDEHKEGIIRLYEDAKSDPDLILCCTIPIFQSLQHFTNNIINPTSGKPLNTLKYFGFFGIYIHVLRVWKDDQDPNLTRTMSHLDQSLSKIIKLVK